MMLFVYPAIFHKEADNAYWVEFPDLEGCQSFGDNLTETMAGAQEALAAYILTILEGGAELTKPGDISACPAPDDGFVSLVSCSIDPYKDKRAVKKTLTIPAWLNERAVSMELNFSQELQDRFCAGLHKLGIIVMATSSIFANVETKCNADCKKLVAALKRAKEKQANRKKFYF